MPAMATRLTSAKRCGVIAVAALAKCTHSVRTLAAGAVGVCGGVMSVLSRLASSKVLIRAAKRWARFCRAAAAAGSSAWPLYRRSRKPCPARDRGRYYTSAGGRVSKAPSPAHLRSSW